MPKKTTGGRASIPAVIAVSGSSTTDSSGINEPLAECDPLVPRRQMLKRKRTELEQSLQEQHNEKELCPLPLVFSSDNAMLMAAQPDRGQSAFSTHGIAHPDPILRGLEFDVPELTEAMLQSISQQEAAGQLECVTIRLHRITPTLKLLCNLASPLSLDLSHTDITDEDLKGLQGIQNLVKLDLSFCRGLTNLSPISHIQTLEVVALSGCLQLVGVGALSRLPRLKELDLSETTVTDEEIRLLSQSHTLVKVDLCMCKKLKNVNALSFIATLEVINLSYCTSVIHMGDLGKLPALKEVDFSATAIKDEDVRLLGECQSLVKIDLHSCKALTNVNPLSSIETLEVINLSSCESLTHVGALGKLPVLKEAYLSFTPITDDQVRQLSECNSLVKIDLHSCKALTNANPLSSIETLEVINLSSCESLTHVGALGKLPALKEVDLSASRITDEDICHLGQSHTLVKINLHSCEALTNVNPLFSIATLEVIILSECTSLTHIDVGALGKLPALKEVNLCESRITDEDVRHLGQSHTLVKVDLHCCLELTNVNPLSSIATLEEIDLSGCTALTRVGELGKLPALKKVDLIGTAITDKEVRLLGQSRTLVKIDLPLCDALTNVNPMSAIATLEEINLNGCASLIHVGELRRLPLLKELDLTKTRITDKEVRLLGECQSLVKIDLSECEALTNANPLSSIETLEEINLASCTSLKRVSALSKLPKLTSMYLQRTPLRNEELGTLTSLREQWGLPPVDIRRSYITAEGCFFQ